MGTVETSAPFPPPSEPPRSLVRRTAEPSEADLTTALVATLDPDARPQFLAHPEIEETLRALHRVAGEPWPTVSLAGADFMRFLGQRARPRTPAQLGSLRAQDLFLLAAFARGDLAAAELFERHFLTRVTAALRKIGVVGPLADEIRQDACQRILLDHTSDPERKHYAGTGDLAAWLCVTAVRRAMEQRKRNARDHSPGEEYVLEHAISGDQSMELVYLKLRYRQHFKEAFAEAARTLTSQERNILRYQLVGGLNIDQIGAIYGVHRATIARWVARSREKLLDRTRHVLTRRLRVPQEEFDSIMRLIDSHMDITLQGFFDP